MPHHSVLLPYAEELVALRRRRRTFEECAAWAREQGLKISANGVRHFLRRRQRRRMKKGKDTK